MARLISGLDAETVRANLHEVREQIATAAVRAGREPGDVQLLAATKYLPAAELPALAEAGVSLVARTAPRTWRRRSPPTVSCSPGTSSGSSRAAASA